MTRPYKFSGVIDIKIGTSCSVWVWISYTPATTETVLVIRLSCFQAIWFFIPLLAFTQTHLALFVMAFELGCFDIFRILDPFPPHETTRRKYTFAMTIAGRAALAVLFCFRRFCSTHLPFILFHHNV
jgi:hypothetical protein